MIVSEREDSGLGASEGPRRIGLGILGTGAIAAELADSLGSSERCHGVAVASRARSRAEAFAAAHGIATAYAGLEEMLEDPSVDAVYVATPHPAHAAAAATALRAGRHVLCEKPLTVSAPEAETVIELARACDRLLLEAFAYKFHPQWAMLGELVAQGAIGRLHAIEVSFGFPIPEGVVNRLVTNQLAGGGILDVGCYGTSLAQQLVARSQGIASPEPLELTGLATLHPAERTDLHALAAMRFPGDVFAQIACSLVCQLDNEIRVQGSDGRIRIEHPCWLAGRREAPSTIELTSGADRRVIEVPARRHLLALELDGFAAMLDEPGSWERSLTDSLANMRTLDRWRRAAGVSYGFEVA